MLDNAFTKAYHKDRHESTGGEALEVKIRYGEALADFLVLHGKLGKRTERNLTSIKKKRLSR